VDIDWEEFRKRLADAWAMSTNAANWIITELARRDVTRRPGDEKLPAMPASGTSIYHSARSLVPDLATQSLSSLQRGIEQKYRKDRYKVLWTAERSLPNFRYPYPLPVHNQGWKASWSEDHQPLVSFKLGPSRITLRLRGGKEFRREIAGFGQLVSGEAVQGELAIYRRRANKSDHRNGMEGRAPGGGEKIHYRIMAKLVAYFPRRQWNGVREGRMIISTHPERLLVARRWGEERNQAWKLNADHVRRMVHAISHYERRRQRMADDRKYEVRSGRRNRMFKDAISRAADKQRNRVNSFCAQAAAAAANFAIRQRVAEVWYADDCHEYVDSFPWYRLKTEISNRIAAAGIQFRSYDQGVREEMASKEAMKAEWYATQISSMLQEA
jgi:hypothetical protein